MNQTVSQRSRKKEESFSNNDEQTRERSVSLLANSLRRQTNEGTSIPCNNKKHMQSISSVQKVLQIEAFWTVMPCIVMVGCHCFRGPC